MKEKKILLISDSLKVKIQDWIIKILSVVTSPITSNSILVRYCITGKKTNRIVVKYLIQISIRESYNDSIR